MVERIPFLQLIACHIKGYIREPEAIFWTYGFPLLMVVGLGIAFQSSGTERIDFDLIGEGRIEPVLGAMEKEPGFQVHLGTRDEALQRLRRNKTVLVVEVDESGGYRYHFDPTNPGARNVRFAVDNALQRAAGRRDRVRTSDSEVTAPGSRYVDFLVPGLIGMNLMGGGLWGIGFVLVDMRIKKLLKRLVGTPMRRGQFLLSIVATRVIFFIPEAFVLLLASWLIFGVPIEGHPATILLVAFVGAMTFAGLGLLAASRARRIESISGIMNLIMLPMWLCSGIFFSAERFPDFMQPFVQALPLTQLINSLRAVILEGQTLESQLFALAFMGLWALGGFTLALKLFRWT